MAGISSKALKTNYAQNNFKYNGKELQNQEFSDGTGLEDYDYGARMYDPQIGRFFNIDPAVDNYKSFSPYMYGANNPLRFVDIKGLGPGERVKKAESMEGTAYSQDPSLNGGTQLRTGDSQEALEYLDCSEFVSRVLADDGITNGVQLMSTKELSTFLGNNDKFIRSDDEPQAGDVFLFRGDDHGHTGIVVSYDKKTGMVETSEARGVKYGTTRVKRNIKEFSGNSWKGFYRPKKENPDKKDKDKNKKKDNSEEPEPEFFKKLMEHAEESLRNSWELINESRKILEESKEAGKHSHNNKTRQSE